MSWRTKTYLLHRWIGLAVSLQLLAWSTGGLYFTLFDIEAIRGTTSARIEEPATVDPSQIMISPVDAFDEAQRAGIEVARITRVTLETTPSGPRYELLDGAIPLAVVDAKDSLSGLLLWGWRVLPRRTGRGDL